MHTEMRPSHLSPADRRLIDGSRRHAPANPRELTIRGTRMTAGKLWTDPNPDRRRLQERIAVYDDMSTTAPVISGALAMIDEAARSARFSLEPANKTQLAGRVAELVDWALGLTLPEQKDRPFSRATGVPVHVMGGPS